ncbi:MAG: alpha/beta fold hydrolase [Deltaproteobacteria bacterium]|nr:alpha/beta fold hydrolase [Deltaproteobacteria bacterium]
MKADPVLAIHGALGSSDELSFLAGSIEGRQVCFVDVPGHGTACEHPAACDFEATLEALEARLPERTCLFGYSMGARLALALTLRAPTRISALVLESGHAGLAAHERAERLRFDALRAAELRACPERFFDAWLRRPPFLDLPEAQRAALSSRRARRAGELGVDGLARALVGLSIGAQPELWQRLPELRLPVLLVTGQRDEKFCAIASLMAAGIRDAEHVVIQGAGHNVHLEAPTQLLDALNEFLGRRTRGRT